MSTYQEAVTHTAAAARLVSEPVRAGTAVLGWREVD